MAGWRSARWCRERDAGRSQRRSGRNEQALSTLRGLGADATVPLNKTAQDLSEAFAREADESGFGVIIDYLWGGPTEALLAAMTRADMSAGHSARARLVQVGESAGPTITLPAAALRSSGLEIMGAGTGAIPPLDILLDSFRQIMARAASGELCIDTERVALADIEKAWQRSDTQGRRLVIIP
jgi:D-arabinose 1-dehydrogenase-like Zn-dependent alcohol dehydrogenase